MLDLGLTFLFVLRAALRVGYLERHTALPELVSKLRRSRAAGAAELDPRLVLGVVEALLPVLPPYGAGRCVKRSLILLDVWSRAGLAPSFHMGVRTEREARGGHTWVTTSVDGISTFKPGDVEEAWRA